MDKILHKRSSNYLKIALPKLNITKCSYLPSLYFFLTRDCSSSISRRTNHLLAKQYKQFIVAGDLTCHIKNSKVVFKN